MPNMQNSITKETASRLCQSTFNDFFSFVFVLSFFSWSRRGHQVVEETFCTYMFLALLIFSGRNRHLGWWRLFCWLWGDDVWLHWDWDGGLEDGLVEGSQDRSNLFNKSLRNGADNFHLFWLRVLVFSNVLRYTLDIFVWISCFSWRRTCWSDLVHRNSKQSRLW